MKHSDTYNVYTIRRDENTPIGLGYVDEDRRPIPDILLDHALCPH